MTLYHAARLTLAVGVAVFLFWYLVSFVAFCLSGGQTKFGEGDSFGLLLAGLIGSIAAALAAFGWALGYVGARPMTRAWPWFAAAGAW